MSISTYRRSTDADLTNESMAWIKFCKRHSAYKLMEDYPGSIPENDGQFPNTYLINLWQKCLGRAIDCPAGNSTHSLVVSNGYVGYNGY